MAGIGWVGYWGTLALAVRGPFTSRNANWRLVAAALGISVGAAIAGAPFGLLSRERLLGMTFRQTVLNVFFLGALVLVLLVGSGRWKRFVRFKPLLVLGEISYGVYLVHTLVFWLVDRGIEIAFPQWPPFTGHFLWILARFVLAMGVTFSSATFPGGTLKSGSCD